MIKILPTLRTEFVVNNADSMLIYQYENYNDDKPSNIIVIPKYAIYEFVASLNCAVDSMDLYDVDEEV